jgi:hypothetical protein
MRLSALTKSLIGLTAVVVRCAAPARVPQTAESVAIPHNVPVPVARPAVESTVVAPAAVEPAVATQLESPPLSWFRQSFGSSFRDIAIVDSQSTEYHGRFLIVVARGVNTDTTAAGIAIKAGKADMTGGVVAVASWTTQWPDFTARIDRVTPDSVYVTGTSPGYRQKLQRAYRWWPTGDFTPPHGPPATATTTPVCGDTLRVDLDAKTIAGIWMNQPIEPVKRQVGAANVIADTAYAEGGEPVLEYTVKLCGHEVRRSWNGASWHDPVFRTPEGLGVGSTLAAFDTAYGKGEAISEEGESVRYWPPKSFGYFFLEVPDRCYGSAGRRNTVDRSCRVTEISFIVFERP